MNVYNEKYGKKSIFDELWEKEHPEEAQQQKMELLKKAEEKKKQEE